MSMTLCSELTNFASYSIHRPTGWTLLGGGVPLADMLPDDMSLKAVWQEEALPRAVMLPGDKAISLPVMLPNEGDPAYVPDQFSADRQQFAQKLALLHWLGLPGFGLLRHSQAKRANQCCLLPRRNKACQALSTM